MSIGPGPWWFIAFGGTPKTLWLRLENICHKLCGAR